MKSLAQRANFRVCGGLTLVVLTSSLAACGNSAQFAGASGKKDSSADVSTDPKGSQGLPVADKFTALNWIWSCQDTTSTKGKQVTADRIDLYGEGTYTFDKDSVNDVPMTVKGQLCRPEQMPRDIVFVIDVSGSMGGLSGNDPVNTATKSCGRLDAVRSLLQKYANDKTQFALVTFDSTTKSVSKIFGKNGAEMLAAAGSTDALATICAAGGGTNYQAGLTSAEAVLATGRSGATKEVYFVSDGAPDATLTGADVAARLRQNGVTIQGVKSPVTIATVMLAGLDDSILSQQIASKGTDGAPLHARIAAADKLTETLAKMANNSIVSASFGIRPVGSTKWQTTDIMSIQKDFNFEIPVQMLDPAQSPDGLEVQFTYKEANGKQVNSTGKIVFTAK